MLELLLVVLASYVIYFVIGLGIGRFMCRHAKIVCTVMMLLVWMYNTASNMQTNLIDAYRIMYTVQPTMIIGNIIAVLLMIGVGILGTKLGKKLRTRKDRA